MWGSHGCTRNGVDCCRSTSPCGLDVEAYSELAVKL
jgi:hypothetical protein